MRHIIIARNLSKTYGTTKALDNVDLSIDRNGVHLLLGPNGSGKSTFIKLCLGLIKPTSGFIKVLGFNPWSERHVVSSKTSHVIEGANMPWWFSGQFYARMLSKLKGIEWESIYEIASYLDVTSYWDKPIYTYSSGMRKKLLLSLGLVEGFQLYLLDEPFTLIDDQTKVKILELVNRLSRKSVIIIATHVLLKKLSNVIESIIILSNGKVKAFIDKNNILGTVPLKISIKLHSLKELNNILLILEKHRVSNIELNLENKVISLMMPLDEWGKLRRRLIQGYRVHSVSIDVERLYVDTMYYGESG